MGDMADMFNGEIWDDEEYRERWPDEWDESSQEDWPPSRQRYISPHTLQCDCCHSTDVKWMRSGTGTWFLAASNGGPHLCTHELKELLQ
jgi:hypothetical protein